MSGASGGGRIVDDGSMNTRARVTVIVFSVALLAVGFATGWYVGRLNLRASVDELSAGSELRERARIMFMVGDANAATQALTSYLKFLDDWRESPAYWTHTDDGGLAFETMLTYTRLALVEDRRRSPDADRYWREAEKAALTAGYQQPSRERLRSMMEALDSLAENTGAGSSPR
jgi:hypothetical protein